jgi:hypothetical protein
MSGAANGQRERQTVGVGLRIRFRVCIAVGVVSGGISDVRGIAIDGGFFVHVVVGADRRLLVAVQSIATKRVAAGRLIAQSTGAVGIVEVLVGVGGVSAGTHCLGAPASRRSRLIGGLARIATEGEQAEADQHAQHRKLFHNKPFR